MFHIIIASILLKTDQNAVFHNSAVFQFFFISKVTMTFVVAQNIC